MQAKLTHKINLNKIKQKEQLIGYLSYFRALETITAGEAEYQVARVRVRNIIQLHTGSRDWKQKQGRTTNYQSPTLMPTSFIKPEPP